MTNLKYFRSFYQTYADRISGKGRPLGDELKSARLLARAFGPPTNGSSAKANDVRENLERLPVNVINRLVTFMGNPSN